MNPGRDKRMVTLAVAIPDEEKTKMATARPEE
jgi:hypothetical protein